MFKTNLLKRFASAVMITSIIFGASLVHIELAYAFALNTLSDNQSSVKISSLSDHTIQFVTPSGVSSGQNISITFPAGYATGTFAIANFDFATSSSASCSGFADALLVSGAASGVRVRPRHPVG